ncbi:MarR family transcriptional regulator [Halorussus pelagicus]|uniref:MarR family transcriptional regulator n=1 Tax=Halorussus pelagicus TaxID=2505977 RepID=UPI000FFBD573|nr:MarR family transcriptional regulator [Halorussus pelagicus]
MVERVPWMSPIDYEILEFYDHHDILLTPKVIAVNIDYDRQYTSKRCRALAEAGLLQQIDKGLYKLSNKGRQFLAGDLDVSKLENKSDDC